MDTYVYLLPGESVDHEEPIIDGKLVFTNYRLMFVTTHQNNVWSVPIALLWKVEVTNTTYLKLTTKLTLSVICAFDAEFACERCAERISNLINTSSSTDKAFCYTFRKALEASLPNHPFLSGVAELLWNDDCARPESEFVFREFKRMKFQGSWKISEANKDFKICPTYPKYHIVPNDIEDTEIEKMAEFRSRRRFPSVVWRSLATGAVLLRCAQPCVGLMFNRNKFDERFLGSIPKVCHNNPGSKQIDGPRRLLIVDARSYRVAQMKRFVSGGSEHPDYYDQAQVCFMDIPNQHAVRLSFEHLTQLYSMDTDVNWYSVPEKTSWLTYIAQLLKSALDVAFALEIDGRPVVVHCTDGWDRTAQLSSLAQLLADPFYRTIEGFTVLVEREWLHFGHKFADRYGQDGCNAYPDERSPIFLQWLDCVHQVRRQFPNYFEFNEVFLVKLGLHIYSGLFGTFLCNSEECRQDLKLSTRTCSVWALLSPRFNREIFNPCYKPGDQRLIVPSYGFPSLSLWDNLYRHALFPSPKNVIGIVRLNEARTTTLPNESPKTSENWSTEHRSSHTELTPVTCAGSIEQSAPIAIEAAGSLLLNSTTYDKNSTAKCLTTNSDIDSNMHPNSRNELLDTALHTGSCSSSFPVDNPSVVDRNQSYFLSRDHFSDVAVKENSQNMSLDGDVATLSVSTEINRSSDWFIPSNALQKRCHDIPRKFVGDGSQSFNGFPSVDTVDCSNQHLLFASYQGKQVSFSTDECNAVFVADEEPIYAVDHGTQLSSGDCRVSEFLPEGPSETHYIFEAEASEQYLSSESNGLMSRTLNLSTSPTSIYSIGCSSTRINGEVELARRSLRRRTPSDNRPFVPFSPVESEQNEKCSTPVATVRRKSLEDVSRVAYSSDTDDLTHTSDFTVHSLPEGELLITETSFDEEDNEEDKKEEGQEGEEQNKAIGDTATGMATSQPSPSNRCQDLNKFTCVYFKKQYLTTSATPVETIIPTPQTCHNFQPCGSNRESTTRPVSAPISPTISENVESLSYFSKMQSRGQSCNSPTSLPSNISSAPTLQWETSVATNADIATLRFPDWDGFPTLEPVVTTCVHIHDSTQSAAQQQVIDRLEEELRGVRRELELERQENEKLRQLLASKQASQTGSEPRSDNTVSRVTNGSTAVIDDLVNGMTTRGKTEPQTVALNDRHEELTPVPVASKQNVISKPACIHSSLHLDRPCTTTDLECRLANAMNDSIPQSTNHCIPPPYPQFPGVLPTTTSLSVLMQPSINLHPTFSANDPTSAYSGLPVSATSRCRGAGATGTATSSATPDGMAQA